MDYNKNFNISYNIISQNTYLVVQPVYSEKLIDYYFGMVENNNISGLLKAHKQTIDNNITLYFDISGKTRLIDYINRNSISLRVGELILKNLVNNFNILPKYFLKPEMCLLDENHIYIDEEIKIYMAFLPFDSMKLENPNKVLSDFFRDFIGKSLITDEKNEYYDGLLRYLIKHDFELGNFKKLLESKDEKKGVKDVRPIISQEQKVEKVIKDIPQPVQEKKLEKDPGIKTPGMLIPGAEVTLDNGKKTKKPEKQKKVKSKQEEKKLVKLFGKGLGKDKSKEEVNMSKEEHVVYGHSPASIPETKEESWQGTVILGDNTVMLNDNMNSNKPYIIHNNNQISIKETPFVIGKINANYIIPKNIISRIHATITQKNNDYYIRDENSKNHTYLNGLMLPPYMDHLLEDGAVIILGNEELRFTTSR